MRRTGSPFTIGRLTAATLLVLPLAAVGLAAGPAVAVPVPTSTIDVDSTTAVVDTNNVHAQIGKYFFQDGVVDEARDLLYVGDWTGGQPSVVRVDLATGDSTAIPLAGDGPATDIAVSPLDGTVYATIGSGETPAVAVIDPDVAYSSGNLPPLVALPSRSPQKIEVGADGRVYVIHFAPGAVSVIGASNTPERLSVLGSITAPYDSLSGGGASAFDDESGRLYYVSDASSSVYVIDTVANPAVFIESFPLLWKPVGATWDAQANQLVVTSENNTITWYERDSATTAFAARVEQLAPLPAGTDSWSYAYSVAVRPDGTALALTEVFPSEIKSFVSVVPPVVDASDSVSAVTVGSDGMSLIPDSREGGTAYVVNAGSGTISTITEVTLSTIATTHKATTDGLATASLTRADKRPLAATLAFTDSSSALFSAPTDAAGLAAAPIPGLVSGTADFTVSVSAPTGLALTGRSSVLTESATSSTSLSLGSATAVEGTTVPATVTVSFDEGTPSGTVSVLGPDSTVYGTGALVGGSAALSLTGLPVGTTALVASFDGVSGVVTGSTSTPVSLTVTATVVTPPVVTPPVVTPPVTPPVVTPPVVTPPVLASSTVRSSAVGGTFDVNLEGFAAGEPVTVTMHSDPVLLGTVTVDANGSGVLHATVPNVPAGTHRIVAVGTESGRTSEYSFVVVGASTPVAPADAGTTAPLASTGADVSGALAGGLLLIGLGLFARRALRRRTA